MTTGIMMSRRDLVTLLFHSRDGGRYAGDEMSDESGEGGFTPEELRAAQKRVFGRGLLRMMEEGASDDPGRYWEERRLSVVLTMLVGGFITFLGVSRLIRVPVIRYVVGLAVAFVSAPIWFPVYGLALMFLKGLRKGDTDHAADQESR